LDLEKGFKQTLFFTHKSQHLAKTTTGGNYGKI